MSELTLELGPLNIITLLLNASCDFHHCIMGPLAMLQKAPEVPILRTAGLKNQTYVMSQD